jgi:hypothetical protein
MMRIRRVAGAVLLTFGLFLGGVSANAATLTVPTYTQAKSNWCWATTAQMIGMFLTVNQKTLCRVVTGVNKTTDCPNVGGTDAEAQNALWSAGVTKGSKTTLTLSKLRTEIDAKRPIYSHIAWKSGGGHAHAVKGYSSAGSSVYVNYNDPWDGSSTAKLWSSYQSNSSFTLYSTLTGLKKR